MSAFKHPGISAPRSNSKSGKIYFLDTRKQALDKALVRKSSILVSFFLRNVLSQEGDFQRGAILKFHSKRFEIPGLIDVCIFGRDKDKEAAAVKCQQPKWVGKFSTTEPTGKSANSLSHCNQICMIRENSNFVATSIKN